MFMQKPCKTMQNAARTERQPAEPSLSPGSLLYVLYVLYLTRQATEHPLSPGSLLYVLYVLYLARQATEHPLSPGSLLYVLYVHKASRVPCYMCYMCYMALYSTYTTNFRAYRIYSTYRTYSKELGERGGSAAWRVRYSTYSTYSKDRGRGEFLLADNTFSIAKPNKAPLSLVCFCAACFLWRRSLDFYVKCGRCLCKF